MTIKTNQIDEMKKLGAEYVASTTIWNIHKDDLKSRNLDKLLLSIAGDFPQKQKLIVLVGRRGRSARSATELHVYSYKSKDWKVECDMGNHSNSHLWDLFIKLDGKFRLNEKYR